MIVHNFIASKQFGDKAEKIVLNILKDKEITKATLDEDKTLHVDYWYDGIGIQIKGDNYLKNNKPCNFCFQESKIVDCKATDIYFVSLNDTFVYKFKVVDIQDNWERIKTEAPVEFNRKKEQKVENKSYKGVTYFSTNYLASSKWVLENINCEILEYSNET